MTPKRIVGFFVERNVVLYQLNRTGEKPDTEISVSVKQITDPRIPSARNALVVQLEASRFLRAKIRVQISAGVVSIVHQSYDV